MKLTQALGHILGIMFYFPTQSDGPGCRNPMFSVRSRHVKFSADTFAANPTAWNRSAAFV